MGSTTSKSGTSTTFTLLSFVQEVRVHVVLAGTLKNIKGFSGTIIDMYELLRMHSNSAYDQYTHGHRIIKDRTLTFLQPLTILVRQFVVIVVNWFSKGCRLATVVNALWSARGFHCSIKTLYMKSLNAKNR